MLAYIDPGSGYVIASGLGYIIAIVMAFLGAVLVFFKKITRFVRMRPWLTLALFLSAGGASFFAYRYFQGAAMTHPPLPFHHRLVILGFDGMSPHIVEPLMREGKLPHLAALQQEGAYRRLATTNPSQSPVAWSGFATGQNPGEHGLFDFLRRDPARITDPKADALALATSNFVQGKFVPVVKAKRFWEYATEYGVESVILNCPITFPPDKINGRMLSGMGVPDILGTEGTFTYYTTERVAGDDEGGRVIALPGLQTAYTFALYGPRRQTSAGIDHAQVPMAVQFDPNAHTATIEIKGGAPFVLKRGEWSDWQSVTFSLGLFKKIKGILQCYLVHADGEHFALLVSPINYDPRDPYFPLSSPEGYARELAEKVGLFYTQGMPNETWSMNEGRLAEQPFLDRLQRITQQRKAMLDLELERTKQGIVFAYFDGTDVVQHMFWGLTDAKNAHRYNPNSPYADTIATWYANMDAIVGEVRQQLEPDDVLIVLSDHGFASFRRAAHVNTWLRQHGYLALKNGDVGGELLQDVDWAKTRAYALGFGAIYLNQQGREAEGIVKPGADSERLKKQLIDELKTWQDGDMPVVHAVYAREEIFWGQHAAITPDLYIGFHDGYRASWQTALGAAPAALVEDNAKHWSGDHLIDPALVPGILFANKPITKEHPSLYDLTPTILQVIGCNKAQIEAGQFDGKPLF